MRIIGIDFGERRIGIAAADDRMRIAIPVETAEVKGDPVDVLLRVIEDQRADEVVIGLPLSLTGSEGPQAQRVREVIEQLALRTSVPIHTYDERLTSAQADRMRMGGGKASNRDAVAASILLQAYIDSQRPYE